MKTFGVVGLGRMGGGLALQAMEKGYTVVGRDVAEPFHELTEAGMIVSKDLADFVAQLPQPRIIFLYIHAGKLIDQMMSDLEPLLAPGDMVVDGGNSYWGDTIRRAQAWSAKGMHFVDLGTSGGLEGARHGACFMLGGPPETKAALTPILLDLCVEGGFVDCGGPGSGHFVKLVHNGIEFGMLQSIGEGMALLDGYREKLPIAEVLHCWRNGSVIRSWLIDLMHQAYVAESPKFEDVPNVIEDTGEVNWLVSDAMQMEVPVPVISLSVMQLLASRDKTEPWAKAIAMMRHGFGGHPYGVSPGLQHERKTSRVGDIWRGDA